MINSDFYGCVQMKVKGGREPSPNTVLLMAQLSKLAMKAVVAKVMAR